MAHLLDEGCAGIDPDPGEKQGKPEVAEHLIGGGGQVPDDGSGAAEPAEDERDDERASGKTKGDCPYAGDRNWNETDGTQSRYPSRGPQAEARLARRIAEIYGAAAPGAMINRADRHIPADPGAAGCRCRHGDLTISIPAPRMRRRKTHPTARLRDIDHHVVEVLAIGDRFTLGLTLQFADRFWISSEHEDILLGQHFQAAAARSCPPAEGDEFHAGSWVGVAIDIPEFVGRGNFAVASPSALAPTFAATG